MTLLVISRMVPDYCAICAVYVTSDDCLNRAREFAIMAAGDGLRLTLDDGTGGEWHALITRADTAATVASAVADLSARIAVIDATTAVSL